MKKKILTMEFFEEGEEISVITDFEKGVPVGAVFGLCGQAIQGILLTARKIGNAKGMTDEQVDNAVFGDATEKQG